MPRWPLPLLAAASPLALAGLLVGGPLGAALFVAASLVFPPALIALAARGPRARAVGRVALALLAILEATAALLAAPGAGLGLMLAGLCALPFLVVAVGHATLERGGGERP